jgi:4-hydroxy-3-methylbut-2-enyl diphosphate reductase
VKRAAEAQSLRVIDATCPLVTKVHVETRRLAKDDYEIVMVGHAGHVEVEGTMGQAPDRMHLVETVADVETLELRNPARVGCVTQTTLSVDDTRDILEALQARYPEIRLPRKDDICYATQNRQDAVKALAEDTQLVFVVGAPASSNSNRLVEVARRLGVQAHLVQDESEIDPAWLENTRSIGITAGASAPEHLVQRVVRRLEQLAPGAALRLQSGVDENVVFQLPALLR